MAHLIWQSHRNVVYVHAVFLCFKLFIFFSRLKIFIITLVMVHFRNHFFPRRSSNFRQEKKLSSFDMFLKELRKSKTLTSFYRKIKGFERVTVTGTYAYEHKHSQLTKLSQSKAGDTCVCVRTVDFNKYFHVCLCLCSSEWVSKRARSFVCVCVGSNWMAKITYDFLCIIFTFGLYIQMPV